MSELITRDMIFGRRKSENIETILNKNAKNEISKKEIELDKLVDFRRGQPFSLYTKEKMEEMKQSISANGVIIPITVRLIENDKYEILAGHNRVRCCRELGHNNIPTNIFECDDDRATLIMLETNLYQRDGIPLTEKGEAYKQRLEILLRKEKDSDQIGNKRKIEYLADISADSKTQIQRFIRLTYLINELKEKVNNSEISFVVGVELSYIDNKEQKEINKILDSYKIKISIKQAEKLRELKGTLNEKVFTRERNLPFHKLCMCILAKKGESLNMELNDFFDNIKEYEKCVSKQAFSKQRAYLSAEVFNVLNHEYVQKIYENTEYNTLKGYIVTAIDGSVFEIPNTAELRNEYGFITSSNSDKARLTARAHTSGIFDVLNDIMIDATIDRYDASERDLAAINIQEMLEILKGKKVIIIFDRGYISIEMIWLLEKLNIKYLFRAKKDTYKKERENMICNDEYINIDTTGKRVENIENLDLRKELRKNKSISTRFVIHKLDTEEDEFLITNLSKDEFSSNEIGELYFKRWNIECNSEQ